jgi:hypothetical protein
MRFASSIVICLLVLLAGCTSTPTRSAAGVAKAHNASAVASNFPKAGDSNVLPTNSAK